VLPRVKDERNILQTIKRRKVNWIGHVMFRNCLLKYGIICEIEGRIKVTGRGGKAAANELDKILEN